MKTDYAPLDIASHLDNEEIIAEYLAAAAEDDDPNILLSALGDVAKARGMAHVAEAAGLGRESLYKALAPGAHPRFETIRRVLRALDVRLALRPETARETHDAHADATAKRIKRFEAFKKTKPSAKAAKAVAKPSAAKAAAKARAASRIREPSQGRA